MNEFHIKKLIYAEKTLGYSLSNIYKEPTFLQVFTKPRGS